MFDCRERSSTWSKEKLREEILILRIRRTFRLFCLKNEINIQNCINKINKRIKHFSTWHLSVALLNTNYGPEKSIGVSRENCILLFTSAHSTRGSTDNVCWKPSKSIRSIDSSCGYRITVNRTWHIWSILTDAASLAFPKGVFFVGTCPAVAFCFW